MDILLGHGYFLYEDPHELAVMKPYPPLGLLYVSSHLKAHGLDARVFDSTFAVQLLSNRSSPANAHRWLGSTAT